jgi:hypothetical protein
MESSGIHKMRSHSNNGTATRLLRAVIAKTSLDLILIGVIVSFAAFTNFNPRLRGAIDAADQARVTGWAYDPQAPHEELEVQLFIDGQFAAAGRANEPREDLVRANAAPTATHGFTFTIAALPLAPGPHRAQVYVVRQTASRSKTLLPLIEGSKTFYVNR